MHLRNKSDNSISSTAFSNRSAHRGITYYHSFATSTTDSAIAARIDWGLFRAGNRDKEFGSSLHRIGSHHLSSPPLRVASRWTETRTRH